MKRIRSLHQSLFHSHLLVGMLPILFIALFFLLLFINGLKKEFDTRIDLLAKGIRSQIQLYMNQPMAALDTIGSILQGTTLEHGDYSAGSDQITALLNSNIRKAHYFESIYLLDHNGRVINAGLSPERERYRQDVVGIMLGHKPEFQHVQVTGQPVWSDTFLSLASGKLSITLYVPSGGNVLAADIKLSTLAEFIAHLSSEPVLTIVVDRNGAILFHPDPELVGKSIMVNDIELVSSALKGEEGIGQFTLHGTTYVGSTSRILPVGWVSLICEPLKNILTPLMIPLLIITGAIITALILAMSHALIRARKVAQPLTDITLKSTIIARGDYSDPLNASEFIELNQLSDSINYMAAAIQKRESELRNEELKYRELVESTSNLVMRLGPDLNIIYANHNLQALTGRPATELMGLPFKNCLTDPEWLRFNALISSLIDGTQSSSTVECNIEHTDGCIHRLLLTLNLHYTTGGSLFDINIIGHDMTVRYKIEQQEKVLEETRQRSQKMELLGLMAGGVAHDLNNILSGIISLPEIMLMRLEEDHPLRESLEMIQDSGERAAAVVADLLTVARGAAAVRKTIDLNELIASFLQTPDFINQQNSHSEVTCNFAPAQQLWPCLGTQIHIEKALMNLVINAFEAITGKGKITISTANVPAEQAQEICAELKSGNYIALNVTDSGSGIPAENIKRIFEPFFTHKDSGRSGTGLGLAIVWNMVKENGGTVTVKSSDQGTQFTVLLPVDSENSRVQTQQPSEFDLRGEGQHILVVDDEKLLRKTATEMLKILGYQVTAVKSGEMALSYLQSAQADLILLDMQMQPGINGRETYARIKQLYPEQKALIVTGYSRSEDVTAALEAGAAGLVQKPFNLQNLGQSVFNALHA